MHVATQRLQERRRRIGAMEGIKHQTVKANGINIHVAEKGEGPVILFIHGFPELWYTWRHQLHALASLGYRAIAPDLRGYGDSDAPADVGSYTCLHVVGDLIGVLDAVGAEKAFVVGHDWGAIIAWYLCLFRPDRVKALLNTSVPFLPRLPSQKPVEGFRAVQGDDFYICRFQRPETEAEIVASGIPLFLKSVLNEGPNITTLPSWLSEDDLNYYVSKYEKTGFAGPMNYYRNMDVNWELTAVWDGSKIEVPCKFMVGNNDMVYGFEGVRKGMEDGSMRKHVPLLKEVVVLEGVGHFLHEEKPDVMNQHIHQFFQTFI